MVRSCCSSSLTVVDNIVLEGETAELGSTLSHVPSFLASLFLSPFLFLVEVRFPAADEFRLEWREDVPRDFLVEEGAVIPFPDFSSLDSMGPLTGVSGESEVLRRFESCFGLYDC